MNCVSLGGTAFFVPFSRPEPAHHIRHIGFRRGIHWAGFTHSPTKQYICLVRLVDCMTLGRSPLHFETVTIVQKLLMQLSNQRPRDGQSRSRIVRYSTL